MTNTTTTTTTTIDRLSLLPSYFQTKETTTTTTASSGSSSSKSNDSLLRRLPFTTRRKQCFALRLVLYAFALATLVVLLQLPSLEEQEQETGAAREHGQRAFEDVLRWRRRQQQQPVTEGTQLLSPAVAATEEVVEMMVPAEGEAKQKEEEAVEEEVGIKEEEVVEEDLVEEDLHKGNKDHPKDGEDFHNDNKGRRKDGEDLPKDDEDDKDGHHEDNATPPAAEHGRGDQNVDQHAPRGPLPLLETTERTTKPGVDEKQEQHEQHGENGQLDQQPPEPMAMQPPEMETPRMTTRRAPVIEGGEDPDPSVREKRDAVKQMMRHAWVNYERYAWGHNELDPVNLRPHTLGVFGGRKLGASIVDAMDTLFLMGMREEFDQGRAWIDRELKIDNLEDSDNQVSVFETNIRFVGGLLACFALTGDAMFRDKAEDFGRRLLPAFNTKSGVPFSLVDLKSGLSRNYGFLPPATTTLSEAGTLQLEFNYLSDVTGDGVYREKGSKIRSVLRNAEKSRGLYPTFVNPGLKKWREDHVSMGGMADSFYEYLLKVWLQSGKEDRESRDMFDEALRSAMAHMLRTTSGGLTYFGVLSNGNVKEWMEHLTCYTGGMLALAADTLYNDMAEEYRKAAADITTTCHESYQRSAVKLGPDAFALAQGSEAQATNPTDSIYILRPETVESYFVLWRTTRDPKYREWGWQVVQALEKHCRVAGGYSGLLNVNQVPVEYDNVQQSFFLAETLKYLYLLFSDSEFFSLDEWVFNTEGHPLPIKGSALYRDAHKK